MYKEEEFNMDDQGYPIFEESRAEYIPVPGIY